MPGSFTTSVKRKVKDLMDVESVLQTRLKPISPRPEFIQGLHKGLMEYSYPQMETSSPDIKKTVLFAIFGIVGLLLVLSLWFKFVVVIISALGMLQTSKRRKSAS